MSALFSPFHLGPIQLANRIVIAPMCQYSAENGEASDWHTVHLGQLALKVVGQDAGKPVWMHVAVLLGFTAICLFLAQRRLQRA